MGTEGRAACRDTGVMMLFFGPDRERLAEREIRERKAKVICALCPLRAECLEYALRHPGPVRHLGRPQRPESSPLSAAACCAAGPSG